MFGLSVATELIQGSTERTWNRVSYFVHSIWSKFNHIRQPIMPKSRKRHHSRSRSRSRSPSRDRSHDREDKYKRIDSHEKERDGKRRKLESCDSPTTRKSVSEEPEVNQSELTSKTEDVGTTTGSLENLSDSGGATNASTGKMKNDANAVIEKGSSDATEKREHKEETELKTDEHKEDQDMQTDGDTALEPDNSIVQHSSTVGDEPNSALVVDDSVSIDECKNNTSIDENTSKLDEVVELVETDDDEKSDAAKKESAKMAPSTQGSTAHLLKLQITPKKVLSPKQIQKKLESEKKRLERQKEKEDKERQRNEERDRLMREKQKKKEEKQREMEQKQKEKELKEEQKQKEKELKEEQKRKEREEKELKRKEKEEQERLKKQEKEMEKQREEEKKQKAAAAFVNFFVFKKSDAQSDEKKVEEPQRSSVFMAFEVKSDMKLPPLRRPPLSETQRETLDNYLTVQDEQLTYLKDLRSGKNVGKSFKTWPYEDPEDDIEIVDEETDDVGEVINEEIKPTKLRAKFLKFHENRRPAYFGTWRKKSKFVKPRRPLAEDTDTFNYEEDSDDDWEEEEQGESLNGSDDDDEKENNGEKDEYELDNDLFVPHGHLSDDEVDDEENKKMSPETLKLKLKLLNEEFEQEKNSKTHKLKPKAIGCIWYKKDCSNVDEAIHNYLKPLAIICRGNIEIKSRGDIFTAHKIKKKKQLNPDIIPAFLKFIHGSEEKKKDVFEKFRIFMLENGNTLEFSKRSLLGYLNEIATLKKVESSSNKSKMCWIVNPETISKYNMDASVLNVESDS